MLGHNPIATTPIGSLESTEDPDLTASNTVIFNDTADVEKSITLSASDTATFNDTADVEKSITLSASDTATFNDTADVEKFITLSASDTATFNDTADVTKLESKSASDTATFNDTADVEKSITLSASDTATFNDTADETLAISESSTDLLTISDTADVSLVQEISPSDSINFNDTADISLIRTVDSTDTIGFNDQAEVAITKLEPVIIIGASNHQLSNMGIQGGAVDLSKRIMTGSIPTISTISLVSSNSNDNNQIYLIEGIDERRASVSELIQVNGLIPVSTVRTYSRICKISKQSGDPLVGNLTVSVDSTILGIFNAQEFSPVIMAMGAGGTEPMDTGVETLELINLLGNAQGRATVDTVFYEKIFIRNNTGDQIDQLIISEHQSDFEGCVTFAVDPCFGFDSTSRNRLTRPADIDISDIITDDPVTVTNFPDQAVLGIWLRIIIPAGTGTILKSWSIKLNYNNQEKIFTVLQPDGTGNSLSTTLEMRNQHVFGGGNPGRFIERAGAKFVEQSFYEPDPRTFRDQFYYNTRINRLFKKIKTSPSPVWKIVR